MQEVTSSTLVSSTILFYKKNSPAVFLHFSSGLQAHKWRYSMRLTSFLQEVTELSIFGKILQNLGKIFSLSPDKWSPKKNYSFGKYWLHAIWFANCKTHRQVDFYRFLRIFVHFYLIRFLEKNFLQKNCKFLHQ